MSKLIPRAKKSLESLTVLEREREQKRMRAQEEELIDQMGQSSDRAALPIVARYVKELDEEERDRFNFSQDILYRLSKNRVEYQRYIVEQMHTYVKEEQIPHKYPLYVDSSDKGIVLGIAKSNLYGAFKIVGIPAYDLYAAKMTAVKLGNTVAVLEGHVRQTDSGIAVPTKEELEVTTKAYGRYSNKP